MGDERGKMDLIIKKNLKICFSYATSHGKLIKVYCVFFVV